MLRMKKGESGFTFIEVLIVICVLMVFASALFTGLQTSAQAAIKADGQATAEALVKSEIEFKKAQAYQANTAWVYSLPSGSRPWTGGPALPAGYTLSVSAGVVPDGLIIHVSDGGSGYTSAPTVSFTGGGGSGATATAQISGQSVASITVTNEGSGYTSAPIVSFSGGGGSGAAATAQISEVSDIQQIIVTVTRGSADKPWMYVNHTLSDYWRTP